MNTEKLLAQIDAVMPGRFDCKFGEIVAIRDACGGGAIETGSKCFYYGFLKGRRAAEAEARKRAELNPDCRVSGYGLLLTIIERNMDNEKMIRALTTHAQELEKLYCGEKEAT